MSKFKSSIAKQRIQLMSTKINDKHAVLASRKISKTYKTTVIYLIKRAIIGFGAAIKFSDN